MKKNARIVLLYLEGWTVVAIFKTTLVSLKRRALFKDKSIKNYKFQSESIWNFSLPNNSLQLKIPLEKFKEDLMVKLLINRPP